MEISNFDYVLLTIWEEYNKNQKTIDENINQGVFGIETYEYINILKELQEQRLVTGIKITGNNMVAFLDGIRITNKGLEYIAQIGQENYKNEIGYEKNEKNIKWNSLLKKVCDELKDIGTTVVAKVLKE